MDFNHDTGLIDSIQSLDLTTLPPLGGTVGVLSLIGTGALLLPLGTTAEQPTGTSGYIRFNTTGSYFEGYNGTSWVQMDKQGTVTSVAATGSTGLTVGGSPITTSGTLTLTLGTELQGLSALSADGLVVRTAAGTYASRTIAGTASNIVVTNGDGIAGNPTINLATAGTPVTASFVKITTDTFGRVIATTPVTNSDITTLVDSTYVNVTGDTMSGSLTFTSGTVTGLATPTAATDAATKLYVDTLVQGLSPKNTVRAATTVSGTLSTDFDNGSVIDGVTLATGDRILIKNQATAAENGIYTVNATGAPTRADDANSWDEYINAYVFVSVGSSQADTGWVSTPDAGGILGTNDIPWVQFAGAGAYSAGAGLTLTGTTFSITAPVATSLGGTGLTSIGTANQVLGVNAGATGLEYKSVTAGTGISVTPTAGQITVANTGVLSFSGGTTGLTPNTATTGAVTLAGTLAVANGGTGLTSTPTNGQIDIGNGTGFTRTTITGTAGQIGVTNGAGSITLTNLGLLSIATSTGTTGLTLTPTTTAGAVTQVLAGTLVTTNGGTGLTSIGTANQILGVNTGGTGLEYKTVTAGTGISITPAAGSLTIDNTGVTSVALTVPSIMSVTGSPITTSGTLAVSLATQTANTVFAGPTSGGAATPTFRALGYTDLPIKLYAESTGTVIAPTATGTNSFAMGSGASTTIWGGKAFANDRFATSGDSQTGMYTLRAITTNATSTEMFLDAASSQRLVLPNNSLWTFVIYVAARRTDATGGGSGYKFEGVVRKDATSGSITLVGTPSKTVLGETNAAWNVTLSADTTNGSLRLNAVGEAAKTIRWVATVITTEVTN